MVNLTYKPISDSILKVTSARYAPVHSAGQVKRGLLAGHRLEMVLDWYSAKAVSILWVMFHLFKGLGLLSAGGALDISQPPACVV